jgi:serine/threonine protein kinase
VGSGRRAWGRWLCALARTLHRAALPSATVQMERHQNIVRYLEHAVDDRGHLHIVMEYAEGGDLPRYVEQQRAAGTWSTRTALRLAAEVADGLKYAHSLDLEHRDIKPDNVLVSGNGTAMLGDWGLARDHGSRTGTTTVGVGSPLWMAPEVLNALPSGKPADIWSLAIVCYQLLCGVFPDSSSGDAHAVAQSSPFGDAGGAATLMVNTLSKAPAFNRLPTDVPAPVRDLLAAMLDKTPERRPDAGIVHARLALEHATLAAAATSPRAATGVGEEAAPGDVGVDPAAPSTASGGGAGATKPPTPTTTHGASAPPAPAAGVEAPAHPGSPAAETAVGGVAVPLTVTLIPQRQRPSPAASATPPRALPAAESLELDTV